MAAYLSVDESIRYWRSFDPYYCGEMIASASDTASLADAVGRISDIEHLHLGEFADENGRLELLVPDARLRSRSKKLGLRVIGKDLPPRSFYRVKSSVYACSPELLLVLFAEKASIYEVIALGCELCGTYSARESTNDINHAQITCVESIEEYLKQVSGMKGAKKCRQALKYVKDGSASPRETDLYMMFCLPSKMRGFGFSDVLLNDTQSVEKRYRSKTNLKKITPDLLWKKESVAIEYESNDCHIDTPETRRSERARLSNDSVRRRTYKAMEVTVLTVTNNEFVDFAEVEMIATMLAKLLGKHGIRRDWKLTARRQELHEWLKVPILKRPLPTF